MSTARVRLLVSTALSLAVICAGFAGPAQAKKKGKKKGGNFATVTKATGAPIPDFAGPAAIPLDTVLDIGGKAFKGKVVSDVNITVQTTGNVAGAANDLIARLSAPSGRSTNLFTSVGGSSASIGPFVMDDDTRTLACNGTTPNFCANNDPFATLLIPFAGRAAGFANGAYFGLNRFYGVPMRGNWILSIWDNGNTGQKSTLTRATLEVTAVKTP